MADGIRTTDRPHAWDTGRDGWGVVTGVSRCKLCGALATGANLNARDCVFSVQLDAIGYQPDGE